MPDHLLTPTISASPPTGTAPWRPQSLLVPAVLGGATAVTALGLINATRLGVTRSARLVVLGGGLLALIGRIAVTLAVTPQVGSGARAIGAGAGALAWLAVTVTQKTPFRAYEMRGGEPARLLWPATVAVLTGGIAEAALVATLLAALAGS